MRLSQGWKTSLTILGIVAGFIACSFYDQTAELVKGIWDFTGSSKEQLLTIGTAALAIATYALFRKTADMADATRTMAIAAQQDSIRSDRQHQQSLSGQLGLNVPYLDIGEPQGPEGDWMQRVTLRGVVNNVGTGPALGVTLRLQVRVPWIAVPMETEHSLGVLPSGGKMLLGDPSQPGDDVTKVEVNYIRLRECLTHPILAATKVRIEWTTIFGSAAAVEYVADNSGQRFASQRYGPDYVPISGGV